MDLIWPSTKTDNVDTIDAVDFNLLSAIGLALEIGKVDKVTGMGLSTNDFTDALETKLNSLHVVTVSATEPSAPSVGDIWIDIS